MDLVYVLETELTELISGLGVGSEGKQGGNPGWQEPFGI